MAVQSVGGGIRLANCCFALVLFFRRFQEFRSSLNGGVEKVEKTGGGLLFPTWVGFQT